MSVIPSESWAAVDLFWYCYSRTPGFSGWCLQRTGYPRPGSVLEQDAYTLWQQRVLESAFYGLQGELSDERQRGQQVAQLHQQSLSAAQARNRGGKR